MTTVADALKKGDITTAKAAYKKFDDGWYDVEVEVRTRSKDLYREIEDNMTKVGRELLRNDKPDAATIVPTVTNLQGSFDKALKTAQSDKTAVAKNTPISGAEVETATKKVSDYLKGKSDSLVITTGAFVTAVKARDLNKSKAAYQTARFDYESIEFLAEAFSEFDVAIDARPDDFPQAENDPTWTGFHPLEKAIFKDAKLTDATDKLADKLLVDITKLRDEIKKMEIDPTLAINGAAELIEEIQAGKITGEEERYSHTDLNDFKANLQSARLVYDTYAPFVKQRNAVLDSDLVTQFGEVEQSIKGFFDAQGVATDYSKVDDKTRKAIAQKVEALADSFSRVAGTLGLKV